MLHGAGALAASLLTSPSAKPLGVDSAGADASESESHSTASTEGLAGHDDSQASNAARCGVLLAAASALGVVDICLLYSGQMSRQSFAQSKNIRNASGTGLAA